MNNYQNKQTGILGEDLASSYLKDLNYQIVCRNYHSRYGEIDIIVLDQDELVFVEVKTRSSSYEDALNSISRAKQQKLYKTAGMYLASHPKYENHFTRFDVIVVLKHSKKGNKPEIFHLKEAFSSV